MPFDSQEVNLFYVMIKLWNVILFSVLRRYIFETIYYHAIKASSELAAREGTYETYKGSPVSKGILQPDMWYVTPSNRWDWAVVREMISKNGVRNSLLVAPMPTASTSKIFGNNECFEPYTSNIYSLRVLRTVWEIKQRTVVEMAADRGCYIDQSQSLNIHMDKPNFAKLTSLHFYAWKKGLKTGMYYLRSCAAADAIKFTVDTAMLKEKKPSVAEVDKEVEEEYNETKMAQMVCSLTNPNDCLACGS
ncbi:unnamed protein product [Arabis nemorensis]|uniref:Ribonucleotide reductase large subunit domain-containing protein n=1 Tax=Arabis nemorensis TaxID=586526 RepID=A0A565C3A6_9BRAS|nr:unnamed protein product [Arabis nemorensis]